MTKILEVTIDPGTPESLQAFLDARRTAPGHVVTVNAEMLLAARADSSLRTIIQRAALRIADSVGVQWVSLLTAQKIPNRIPGVDLMSSWLSYAERHGKSVFLFGAEAGVLQTLLSKLSEKYPDLIVQGISDISVRKNGESDGTPAVRAAIEDFSPDFIFVALGHGKQEHWIARNIDCFPHSAIAMGVGGSFSLIAGIIRRAPCWMQKIGLEWLWRLLQEPWRILRILRAVFVFPPIALLHALFGRK